MAYMIYAGQDQWVFEKEAIALTNKALGPLGQDEQVKVVVFSRSPIHGVTRFETEWISKADVKE